MPNLKPKNDHRFLVIALCLVVILISAIIIQTRLFQRNSVSDTNEAYFLPSDIQRLLDNPELLYSPNYPLGTNFPTKRERPTHFRIPILLYHYVEYVKDPGDKIRISLDILPYILDQQVKTLKDAGFTFLTPSDIRLLYDGTLALPKKPIILSFDDGYRDFYTDVFPILKKYKARAIAYIVPGFLDKSNNLTHKMLREIATSGLVEIGAHTMDHAYLKGLNEKTTKYEVWESKKALEKELGLPIVSFAYPYGAFDLKAAQIVKNAGFYTAVSTVAGNTVNTRNLYFLYRLRPGMNTGTELLQFLDNDKF